MNKQHLAIFVCLFCIGLASCSYAQEQQKKTKEFHLPDVPVTLTAPEDRADYLSLHYWDHFDFADTSLISRPEITEQVFVDFISVLPYSSKAQTAVDTLFCRALVSNEMIEHFIALTDKYLYEPNSPMHNEELHILFLRALVNNPDLGELDKMRPRHQLEMALKTVRETWRRILPLSVGTESKNGCLIYRQIMCLSISMTPIARTATV